MIELVVAQRERAALRYPESLPVSGDAGDGHVLRGLNDPAELAQYVPRAQRVQNLPFKAVRYQIAAGASGFLLERVPDDAAHPVIVKRGFVGARLPHLVFKARMGVFEHFEAFAGFVGGQHFGFHMVFLSFSPVGVVGRCVAVHGVAVHGLILHRLVLSFFMGRYTKTMRSAWLLAGNHAGSDVNNGMPGLIRYPSSIVVLSPPALGRLR